MVAFAVLVTAGVSEDFAPCVDVAQTWNDHSSLSFTDMRATGAATLVRNRI